MLGSSLRTWDRAVQGPLGQAEAHVGCGMSWSGRNDAPQRGAVEAEMGSPSSRAQKSQIQMLAGPAPPEAARGSYLLQASLPGLETFRVAHVFSGTGMRVCACSLAPTTSLLRDLFYEDPASKYVPILSPGVRTAQLSLWQRDPQQPPAEAGDRTERGIRCLSPQRSNV